MTVYLTGATGAMRATAYALTNPRPAPAPDTLHHSHTARSLILSLSTAERAFAARNWNPAETTEDPCGCGRACRHAETCPTCTKDLLHFSRRPATNGAITEWIDIYVCDCDTATEARIDQTDLPWGEIEDGTIQVFPGIVTLDVPTDRQAA